MSRFLPESKTFAEPTEQQLSMDREKKRSLTVGLMYRVMRFGSAIFGRERMLRLSLNTSRLFGRFAFEMSSEGYGERFHNLAMALSEDILKAHIPAGGSVVDVGCGQGRACRMAAKYASRVVGIDYDEPLIRQAIQATNDENVEYIHGDVTANLGGQQFDLAMLIHVIEHIDDADKILQSLAAVAKKLIVEVPDFQGDPLNVVRLEQGLPYYSDADHIREYTESILIDQLTRNGWTILETRKNGGAVLAVATAS